MLKYILIAVLALSSLLIGFLLNKVARDEIKPGRKYLLLLQTITSVAVTVGIAAEISPSLSAYVIASFITGLLVSLFLRIRYLSLGISAFASASVQSQLFLFICLATFLYGLPTGSLIARRQTKAILTRSIMFLVPAAILLFDLSQYASYLLAFSAGSLLGKK